ncbi:hypothetical protein [Lacticaseibacillus rhamnosus]|uniref:hypothetical protein n=1 Tax=Lacticaseibacillus rhamnosus TaxID=47715 RepID=UPI00237FAFF0|nr:hypothetical protein [Lacticaseibacillus rhamnosus]MDE3295900.1 hypothetical protein [Lacticaseibacillus rhamnosus]
MPVSNEKKMREELMAQIDPNSAVAVEKVKRYISMVKVFNKLQADVLKHPTITVVNGSQKYTKTHPGINEMNRINGALIALGKDMGLSAPPTPGDTKSNGYDKGALL